MSILKNRIATKFIALNEYLSFLRKLQKLSKKNLLNDYIVFGAAEHYLQLCIEIVKDVSSMIIVNYTMERPDEPAQIFDVLLKNKVISSSLHHQMYGMFGFRNVLVHEYENIDRERIYNYLQKNLDQFVAFRKSVGVFLAKKAKR